MSLPRILELVLAFFEDVVFMKKKKKEIKVKTPACFFQIKIFSLEKLCEKRKVFLWGDVSIC